MSNIFDQTYENVTRGYCRANSLPQPIYDAVDSDSDRALEGLTDEYRRDLLDQFRSEELTASIIHEYELDDTDLCARLMTVAALWNNKADTALERMRLIDQLLYDTADKIAEKLARKDLDL